MEVMLEPTEEVKIPKDTFVALRIGDVQKQSRFGSTRTYKFPDPGEGKKTFGRIEVFRRVGHVAFSFDTSGDVQDVEVPVDLSETRTLSMSMKVKNKDAGSPKAEQKKTLSKGKARMDEAVKYLADFNLEERLSQAMLEVIVAKPENPYVFLAERIASLGGNLPPKEPAKPPPLPEDMQPPPLPADMKQPPAPEELSKAMAPAAEPPKMEQVGGFAPYYSEHYKGVPPDSVCWSTLYGKFSKPAPKPDGQPVSKLPVPAAKVLVQLIPFAMRPSVGSWLAPVPTLVASPTLTKAPQTFEFRPSVGTWLSPTPHAMPQLAAASAPPCTKAATSTAMPVRPESSATFPLKPSVGTWLMSMPASGEAVLPFKPPEQPMLARTDSYLKKMPKEEIISGFKQELQQKDVEIVELKKQLGLL